MVSLHLPVNEELLTNRIKHSEYSFTKPGVTSPSDEGYLMVGLIQKRVKWLGQRELKPLSVGMFRFILSHQHHSAFITKAECKQCS